MSKRANGEGSIWRRKDGRWCASYYVPTPRRGRVRKYVYGTSHEDVRRKLTEIMRNVDKGIPVAAGSQTVAEYLTEWLQHVRPLIRESTHTAYESNVRLHIVPRIGRRKLDRLTVRDVRLMLDDLGTTGKRPRLVQYVHATLRAALEHAVREELVARNVARLVQVPRPQRTERKALSAEDAKTLLKAAAGDRLHALYVVVLLLGLRRSEVTGLRWRDVDLAAGTLTVRQALHRTSEGLVFLPPKTHRSRRTVPLPAAVAAALRQHESHQRDERARVDWPDTDLVFTTPRGTPIEPRNLSRMFGELTDRAGVGRVQLHELRHTCVSLLLALGVHPRVVMEIVGHTAIEMTMNVYAHVALDTQREALGRLDDLLGDEEG